MSSVRSGVAALVAAAWVLAASPAAAVIAVCVATDSDGKWYTEKQTGVFEGQAIAIATMLAKSACRGSSKHPDSCKISCRITSR